MTPASASPKKWSERQSSCKDGWFKRNLHCGMLGQQQHTAGDVTASGRLGGGDDGDDVSKVPLRLNLPPGAILSVEDHQVMMDGRGVTMATRGLPPVLLSLVFTACQSPEWEHETNFPLADWMRLSLLWDLPSWGCSYRYFYLLLPASVSASFSSLVSFFLPFFGSRHFCFGSVYLLHSIHSLTSNNWQI